MSKDVIRESERVCVSQTENERESVSMFETERESVIARERDGVCV